METETAVILLVAIIFVGILTYKAFKQYTIMEATKSEIVLNNKQEITIKDNEIKELLNSNRNYIYKMRRMRENYELNYDDIDIDEDEEDGEAGFKLSDLATSIYPKLPPSLAKLIDKESFQDAIVKTVEKRPEVLTTFIEKFLNKKGAPSSDGSTNTLANQYL